MLKAGVSIKDISPEKGVQLAGYPHCPRPNTGVHDPLYASCLYLDNGRNSITIVTLDLLYIGKIYVKRLRAKLGGDILFCASHTHSGPWTSTPLASELAENITVNEKYIKFLIKSIEQNVTEARMNTFPAKVASFIGKCGSEQGVGGNRRVKGGVADPSVNVLSVIDSSNVVRACWLNYTLHPTFIHADSTLVTADYPAYIRRYLKFSHPEAVFLFSQGTSGDQSSRYHRIAQDYEEAARVGSTLGAEVFHCLRKTLYSGEVEISVKNTEVELPIRKFPDLEAAWKDKKAAQEKFMNMSDKDYIEKRNAELAMFGAENIFTFAEMEANGTMNSDELPCEIQTITIGDTLIVAIQGELFVEYGLAIKDISKYPKTFVCEVSNGSLPGYIYTPEAGIEGGYEVGTSVLSDAAGDVVLDAVRQLMN
ncbi:MAG: hypothetical protein ACYC5K_10235 [Saccharofermentanales bacterium]